MKSGDAVVTKLTVARLFNLGNYEHERIEVTVEARGMEARDGSHIPDSITNPDIVLAELRLALECCKPVKKAWEVTQAERIERGELSVWNGEGEEPTTEYVRTPIANAYREALKAYTEECDKRSASVHRLRSIGQAVTVKGGAS